MNAPQASEWRSASAAGLLVAAVLAGLWSSFGVSISEMARFVAYEAVLVGLPGILALRALTSSRPSLLGQVAIGWPLGYAIGIGAFMITAALDARWLFPCIPLGVAALAALFLWRRGAQPDEAKTEPETRPTATPFPPAAIWAVAGVAVVALGYLALGSFTKTPLPRDIEGVSYLSDLLYAISLTAEAKNHWPMEYPGVADSELPYHFFSFIQIAGVSQVTGIEVSTLVFRLVPAALIVLITLQVTFVGRQLGTSVWVGPLAAGLTLLVGELDLDPERISPFANVFFVDLAHSMSFLLGIPLFLAVTATLLTALSGPERPRLGDWIVVGVLLGACGGMKASLLPIVVGGLVLWLAWNRFRQAGPPAPALIALALSAIVFGGTFLLLYVGAGGGGLSLGAFEFTEFSVLEGLPSSVAALPTLVALCLPCLGIFWLIANRGLDPTPGEAWLLALFLASLGPFLILSGPGFEQAYFLNYGYIAGCTLSALGIVLFCERAGERRPLLLAALVAWAAVAGIAAAFVLDGPDTGLVDLESLGLHYAVVGAVILAVAGAAARVTRNASVGLGAALLLTISLGLVNTPLDEGVGVIKAVRADQPLAPPSSPALKDGLTAETYGGLRWIRDHSTKDDVIAVNNRFNYYTAFSERRALFENWGNTSESEAVEAGIQPFPELQRLNKEAFMDAAPAALKAMSDRYGVDFLVVDQIHGSPSPALARAGDPAFENEALVVYRLPLSG